MASLIPYYPKVIQGYSQSVQTYVSTLKDCALTMDLKEGKTVHAKIVKSGLSCDRYIVTSIIRFYSDCGDIDTAHQVFDRISDRDPTLWTELVMGYARNGDIESAHRMFDEMPERDVVSWNAMLSCYTNNRQPKDAVRLFNKMLDVEITPNEVTLIVCLSACSQLGFLDLGKWLHAYITKGSGLRSNTLSNALVNMYAKCGRLDASFDLFSHQEHRNLESWNTMLTGFALHGCGKAAITLFGQMLKMGLYPDRITFLGVLMACSHGGLIDHARWCLNYMIRMNRLKPMKEHYGCVVDVLARGGLLEEAYRVIENAQVEPDAHMWGALLNGCQKYSNYELGLKAAYRAIELEPEVKNRFVSLINLHMMAGKVEEAMEVRNKMANIRTKHSSGSSMIEIDGVVQMFLAGDRTHLQSNEIYSMIRKININSGSV